MTRSLFELIDTHAGKTTDKWSLYVREYERLFRPFRARGIYLLEIGVQNGGSLDIWRDYFQQARLLVGCDIDEGCRGLTYADSRVQVVVGDANAAATRDQILGLSPCYDLIIDDGSHTSSDIVKSFALYFGALAEGGLYVVEDLHCSYWSDFQGGLHNAFSSIHFFKSLCDIVNHQSWGLALSRQDLLKDFSDRYGADFPEDLLAQIHSVEFLNSLCVIRKAAAGHNTLGIRVVRGRDALVDDGPLQVDGHEMAVPPQSMTAPADSPPVYFDEAYYLSVYPDVAAAGVNALEHYLANGKAEGRYPTAEMAVLAAVEEARLSGDRQTGLVLAALLGQVEALTSVYGAQGRSFEERLEASRKLFELGQLEHAAQLEALAQARAEHEKRERQWRDELSADLAAATAATQSKVELSERNHAAQLAAMAVAQAKQDDQARQNEERLELEFSGLKEELVRANAAYLESLEASKKLFELGQLEHAAQLKALAQARAEHEKRERQWQDELSADLAAATAATQSKVELSERNHAAQLAAVAVAQAKQDDQARRSEERLELEFSGLKEELVRMNAAYLDTKQTFDARVAALTVELQADKASLEWRVAHPFKSLWRDLVSRKKAGSAA